MRGERGSSSVEMVIALPIVLTVLFLAVQAGTWFHARSIALASAQSGARTSAMLNSSLEAGLSSATETGIPPATADGAASAATGRPDAAARSPAQETTRAKCNEGVDFIGVVSWGWRMAGRSVTTARPRGRRR